jgi:hypothetical protein
MKLPDDQLPPASGRRKRPGAANQRGSTGSLTRRMIGVSALWIAVLLGVGGFALDRVLTSAITRNFDAQLDYVLTALIASAEIGPDGEVPVQPPARRPALPRALFGPLFPDQRRRGFEPFRRARCGTGAAGRAIRITTTRSTPTTATNSRPRRCASLERDVGCPARRCAGASRSRRAATGWTSRSACCADDGALVRHPRPRPDRARRAAGLLRPVAAAPGAPAIAAIRSGEKSRIEERLPREIEPLTEELNACSSITRCRPRRRAATPATSPMRSRRRSPSSPTPPPRAAPISPTPCAARRRRCAARSTTISPAPARSAAARAPRRAPDVWPSLEAVERAVSRLYENVTVDLAGDKKAAVRVERQDLDEMLGNLIENAAKYGGGRVFVTVGPRPNASRSRSRMTAAAFPRRSGKHLRPRRPARHRQARHRPRPRHRPRRRPDLRRLDQPRGERGSGRPARPADTAAAQRLLRMSGFGLISLVLRRTEPGEAFEGPLAFARPAHIAAR